MKRYWVLALALVVAACGGGDRMDAADFHHPAQGAKTAQ